MEEKVLIQSQQYDVKKILKIFVIIGVILSALIFIALASEGTESYNRYYKTYQKHIDNPDCGYSKWGDEKCWDCRQVKGNTAMGYAIGYAFEGFFFLPVVIFALIGGLIYLWLHSYEMTITDKRIYGKVAWGKRVDLPVDSVSATATVRLSKGVSVSTSSGRISFLYIKNADEVYNVINNLLIERQQERAKAVAPTTVIQQSDDAEQLKKFKALLDSGVITQEEFDAKKKQILGL